MRDSRGRGQVSRRDLRARCCSERSEQQLRDKGVAHQKHAPQLDHREWGPRDSQWHQADLDHVPLKQRLKVERSTTSADE
jgi:hypothetical protein